MAVSQFVAMIEREEYVCSAKEYEDLQEWMDTLVSRYAEDPETIGWIARVNAGVEESVDQDEGI